MKSHDRDIADQKEYHCSENSLHSALWSSERLITRGLGVLGREDRKGGMRKREEGSHCSHLVTFHDFVF